MTIVLAILTHFAAIEKYFFEISRRNFKNFVTGRSRTHKARPNVCKARTQRRKNGGPAVKNHSAAPRTMPKST